MTNFPQPTSKALFFVSCSLLVNSCDKRQDSKALQPAVQTQDTGSPKAVTRARKVARVDRAESDQALRKFASGFENLSGLNRDHDTLAKQRELALAALPEIGGGDGLLKFLDYLTERGAGDLRKELVENHLGVVFTGPRAEQAREWLLSVEDAKLREALSLLAGKAFSGPGFREYFEEMGNYGGLHSQADLLVIHAARGPKSKAVRHGAACLRRHLVAGARVLIGLGEGDNPAEQARRWLATGGMRLETEEAGFVELRVDGPPDEMPAPERIATMSDIAGRILVISLPEREDRRIELLENWKPLGIRPEWVDGIRPNEKEIQWREMKGMEAYGRVGNLRGGYVVGATGCKRAGIAALERLLESDAATGLICQDDCRWEPDALRTIQKACLELPSGWDLVYFSASARQPHEPFSPHLVRIMGARLCTAILWKRQTAERLLPRLKECDCEWDVFMQRSHAELRVFGVVPMPARQARSRSDIAGGIVQPSNR